MDRLRRPRSRSPIEGYKRNMSNRDRSFEKDIEGTYLNRPNYKSDFAISRERELARPKAPREERREERPIERNLYHEKMVPSQNVVSNFNIYETNSGAAIFADKEFLNQGRAISAKDSFGSKSIQDMEIRLERMEKLLETIMESRSKVGFIINPEHDMQGITTSMWLNSIEDEAAMNKWADVQTIKFMKSKMSGLLLDWFESLPQSIYSWRQYKLLIGRCFPDHTDFAKSLKLLTQKIKDPMESIENYYYTKLYLLECCKITGRDAVSCIIDGLGDETLEREAHSCYCSTPQELLKQFLLNLKVRVTKPPNEGVGKSSENIKKRLGSPGGEKWGHTRNYMESSTESIEMFSGNSGMSVMKKKNKKNSSCFICKEKGHLSYECKYKSGNSVNKITSTSKFDVEDDIFFVNCYVNNRSCKALIDTGSSINIAKEQLMKELQLEFQSSKEHIIAYGGHDIPVLGETTIFFTINNVSVQIPVFIVSDHVQDIPLIIGQPFLKREDVTVIRHEGVIFFLQKPAQNSRDYPFWTQLDSFIKIKGCNWNLK